MPVRFLMYAGLVYSRYIEDHNLNIYGKTQKKLPVPKLVCFYVYLDESDDPELAVDRAIDELPEDSEIKAFLLENRAEVKMMCITEYDEIKTMNMIREECYEEGLTEGRTEGRMEGAIEMLAGLVKDKIISAADAAKRLGMSPVSLRKQPN